MRRILITGGSGFIGSNFVDYVIEKTDWQIINLSRHTYAMNPKALEHLEKIKRYKFVAGNVTDSILMMNLIKGVDSIVHFAAETHVDRSFIYPRDFLTSNLLGTFTILEVLRHIKKKPKLISMSTDEVFGDIPKGYCKEDDRVRPRNPYSASKASAEMYCNAYFHSFKIPVIIARSMNNFGPRQHPEKLIAKMITRCLSNTPFTLFKGGSVRGWIYVKDTCDAILTILENGEPGEIYHIPPDAYLTVPDVAEIILKLANKQHLFQGYTGRRLKDDERYALDGTKMTYDLKWRPKISFDNGIKQTIEWYRQNKWFWEGVYAP
jgi:dTDP-glucose 4,6-dehydratase